MGGRHEEGRQDGVPAAQLIDEGRTYEQYTQFDERTKAEIAQNVLEKTIENS
jgi:hypothetical protein